MKWFLVDCVGRPRAVLATYGFSEQHITAQGERTWSANVEVLGPRFGMPADGSDFTNPHWLDLSASYGQPLLGRVYASLSASYRLARAQAADRYSVSLSVGSALYGGVHVNLNLSHRSTRAGAPEQGAFLSLTWAIPKTQQNLSGSYDTSTRTGRAAWRYLSPRSVNSLNASVTAERTAADSGLTGGHVQ